MTDPAVDAARRAGADPGRWRSGDGLSIAAAREALKPIREVLDKLAEDGELAAALAENKRLRAEVKSLLRECRADNEPLTQGERDVFAYIAEQLDDLLDGGSDDRE